MTNKGMDVVTRKGNSNSTILVGKISWFGGSQDTGVKSNEILALYNEIKARDLDKPIFNQYYCAMRWDYELMATELMLTYTYVIKRLRKAEILVRFDNKSVICVPIDYGPAKKTGRLIDVSLRTMHYLGCKTDDEVEVLLPGWIRLE